MHTLDWRPTSSPAVRLSWVLGLALVAIVAMLFAPVGHADFVAWDDDLHVYQNPRFQPVTWDQLGKFWTAPYEHLYIPVTYSAWGALAWLSERLAPGPLQAGFFHRFNLILHLGSVLVVYRLALIVLAKHAAGSTRRTWAAATAALVFGLHPLQVEAVAWVSGLKDVLCGWWALVALWQYLEFLQGRGVRRAWGHYGLASVAFGLALLAKPAAVVVPLMAGLLAVGGMAAPYTTVVRSLLGWMLVAALWSLWSKGLQPDALMGYITPWWARPIVVADSLAFYLGKLLWPFQLGPDYGRTPTLVLTQTEGILTSLATVMVGLLLWIKRRRWSGVGLATLVWVAALSPVLGGVPFLFQFYSTVADRYAYLSLFGAGLAAGWCLLRTPRCLPAAAVVILTVGFFGWRTMHQLQVWQDTVSLFTHALQINPRSALAYNNLGWALAQKGQTQAAMQHYQEALRLRPTMLEASYNLGDALAAQDRLDEAIAQYSRVLTVKPTWAEVHNNLGTALMRRGDLDAAIHHYREALRFKPNWSLPYNNMGDAWARVGQTEEAMRWFAHAMRLRPQLPEAAYNLAGLLWQAGQAQEAIAAYREAVRRRPDWPQAANQLAWLLTQQANPSSQDIAEAVTLAERACQATAYRNPIPLRTLAAAYHLAGQRPAAIEAAQYAVVAAQASGATTLATEITDQLRRYETGHGISTHP